MIMVFSLREDVKVDVFFKLLGFSSVFLVYCFTCITVPVMKEVTLHVQNN